MQPTLVIAAPAWGMVFINGRLAGEVSADRPLFAPAAPCGAVFLEFRPLEDGWHSLARKLVLSNGLPLADLPSEGVFALCWPDGAIDVELSPRRTDQPPKLLNADGLGIRFFQGNACGLEVNSVYVPLPENASEPSVFRTAAAVWLTGKADGGQYLCALTPDGSDLLGVLQADAFDFEPPDAAIAVTDSQDLPGHGVRERWQVSNAGLQRIQSVPVWMDGAPRMPRSAEETALAAAEALIAHRLDEASAYFSEELRPTLSSCDLRPYSFCLPMKYAAASDCIGLVQMRGEHMAVVHPLHYQACFRDGRWLLTRFSPR